MVNNSKAWLIYFSKKPDIDNILRYDYKCIRSVLVIVNILEAKTCTFKYI